MIQLGFITSNREVITLVIDGKTVIYKDKIWKEGIKFMPKDHQLILNLLKVQRKIPYAQVIIGWINEANSGKNLEEYNNAKTEEELAEIIRRDAKVKGLIEVTNGGKP